VLDVSTTPNPVAGSGSTSFRSLYYYQMTNGGTPWSGGSPWLPVYVYTDRTIVQTGDPTANVDATFDADGRLSVNGRLVYTYANDVSGVPTGTSTSWPILRFDGTAVSENCPSDP
jgi:hypothetical protein